MQREGIAGAGWSLAVSGDFPGENMDDGLAGIPSGVPPPSGAMIPRPRVWPWVIGVLSMVIAGQGLYSLLTTCSFWLTALVFQRAFAGGAQSGMPGWLMLRYLSPVPFGLVSIVLLVAGLRLWFRKADAAILHMVYAVLAISAKVAMICLLLAAARPPGSTWWSLGSMDMASVPPALAYPVFLLVWFSRPVIREQIQEWKADTRRDGYEP